MARMPIDIMKEKNIIHMCVYRREGEEMVRSLRTSKDGTKRMS